MFETFFILIIMFVAYVVFKPAKEQNTTPAPPVSPVEPEQPIAPEISPAPPQKPVEAVKPSAPRSVRKNSKEPITKPVTPAKEKSVPELVGITAGSIWHYLNKTGPTTVAKMIRELEEDEKTIQRSIGWLAQEGKITLEIIDRSETISLKN